MKYAWHFVGKTLRNGALIPKDGEWLRHDGPLKLCQSGLHVSTRIIDALRYAPGSTICRVGWRGEHIADLDKIDCRERKIIWRLDVEEQLRVFARWCALQVKDQWDMPDIVLRYLKTGDESIRTAARDAAWAASGAAAWAAGDAAGAAAGDAAWAAARAAEATAEAARDAAWDAAWAAARDAARDAQSSKLKRIVEKRQRRSGEQQKEKESGKS